MPIPGGKEPGRRLETSSREMATEALLSLASEETQTQAGSSDSVLESAVMDVDATSTREAATMTDTDFAALEKECSRLRRENSKLKETLNCIRLNKEALDGADERV